MWRLSIQTVAPPPLSQSFGSDARQSDAAFILPFKRLPPRHNFSPTNNPLLHLAVGADLSWWKEDSLTQDELPYLLLLVNVRTEFSPGPPRIVRTTLLKRVRLISKRQSTASRPVQSKQFLLRQGCYQWIGDLGLSAWVREVVISLRNVAVDQKGAPQQKLVVKKGYAKWAHGEAAGDIGCFVPPVPPVLLCRR